ncbi:MAG TPA: hypothetical protein ACFYEF_09275 [Candidatus Wunengus sp. YC63]|uniref:hypothetical protein n=1 Tax=unclassified Candidatus Wunengus TaxID=3367695 RepID=UPI004026FF3C
MKINTLVHLSFRLNEALDSGKTIPLPDIEKAIEDGTIFNLLGNNIPDFKTFISQDDKTFLLQEWQKILDAYSSRKFGVSNSGYCLILAYCLQAINDIENKQ